MASVGALCVACEMTHTGLMLVPSPCPLSHVEEYSRLVGQTCPFTYTHKIVLKTPA